MVSYKDKIFCLTIGMYTFENILKLKIMRIILISFWLLACAIVQAQVFTNEISKTGLPTKCTIQAIADFDNDGFDDLCIGFDSAGTLKGAFYKNLGNGTFTLKTKISDNRKQPTLVSSGQMLIVDFNHDGWNDILELYNDSLRLFENKNFTFTNVSAKYGITNPFVKTYSLIGNIQLSDYDADGDIDFLYNRINSDNSKSLFVIKNEIKTGGKFNTSLFELIPSFATASQGPIMKVFDYDNDQDEDVLYLITQPCPEYFHGTFCYHPMKLFRNDGAGKFTDVTVGSGLPILSPYGFCTFWDYNNDGFIDILDGTTDAVFNSTAQCKVIKNNGNGTFTDVSSTINLRSGNYYFGSPRIADFQNDMDWDVIWAASGFGFPGTPFYINNNGTYSDNASTFGLKINTNTGSQNASAPMFFDYDNDGKQDVFYGYGNSTNSLLMKNILSDNNNWIKIRLKGCESNSNGVGARIVVNVGGKKIVTYNSSNYLLTNEMSSVQPFHFGVGANGIIDSIEIYWIGGTKTILKNTTVNQTIIVQDKGDCNNNSTTCTTTVTMIEKITVTDTLRISSITGFNTLPQEFGTIKIYPNPSHDILNISISKPNPDYIIKIADNVGKTVHISSMNSNSMQINMSQFAAKGLYIIQILDNTDKILDVRKLVLE